MPVPSCYKICIVVTFLASALALPARSQESVADAARSTREQRSNSTNHPRIITDADLGPMRPLPSASAFHLQPSSTNADEAPNSPSASGCDNPEAQRLIIELQAAQQELAQIRSELQYNPPVVSGNDLDLQYFQPGNSGLDVGSPLRIACEPPEAARIQIAIYQAEDELNLLQRQFALDQDDYYSVAVTERLGGNPKLDAEQQQIQDLQAEIDGLKAELAALLPPQIER